MENVNDILRLMSKSYDEGMDIYKLTEVDEIIKVCEKDQETRISVNNLKSKINNIGKRKKDNERVRD